MLEHARPLAGTPGCDLQVVCCRSPTGRAHVLHMDARGGRRQFCDAWKDCVRVSSDMMRASWTAYGSEGTKREDAAWSTVHALGRALADALETCAYPHDDVKGTSVAIQKAADDMETTDANDYVERLRCFFRSASMGAAGTLRKVTKPMRVWDPPPTSENTPAHVTPLAVVESTMAAWASEWKVEDVGAQQGPRPWLEGCSDDPPIAEIDEEMVEGAAKQFKCKTGVGCDACHPWCVATLSSAGKQAYARLLNECEAAVTWPTVIACIHYLLIPKAEGGERPIGLFVAHSHPHMGEDPAARSPQMGGVDGSGV